MTNKSKNGEDTEDLASPMKFLLTNKTNKTKNTNNINHYTKHNTKHESDINNEIKYIERINKMWENKQIDDMQYIKLMECYKQNVNDGKKPCAGADTINKYTMNEYDTDTDDQYEINEYTHYDEFRLEDDMCQDDCVVDKFAIKRTPESIRMGNALREVLMRTITPVPSPDEDELNNNINASSKTNNAMNNSITLPDISSLHISDNKNLLNNPQSNNDNIKQHIKQIPDKLSDRKMEPDGSEESVQASLGNSGINEEKDSGTYSSLIDDTIEVLNDLDEDEKYFNELAESIQDSEKALSKLDEIVFRFNDSLEYSKIVQKIVSEQIQNVKNQQEELDQVLTKFDTFIQDVMKKDNNVNQNDLTTILVDIEKKSQSNEQSIKKLEENIKNISDKESINFETVQKIIELSKKVSNEKESENPLGNNIN